MNQRVIWHTPEPCSGAARYPREMITALTAEGVPVHFVCPRNYRFREELSRNRLVTLHLTRARSVDTKRGLLAKLWTNTSFLISSAYALASTARKNAIVHFQHTLHFPFSALFFLTARLRNCTIIFTVHDPVPHKWFLPHWLRWIERGSLAWAYHVSDTLIVHSEPGKRTLIDQFGLSAEKIAVIARGPYGLGAGILPMPAPNRLEILLFGSIRENKGVHLAIEALQTLARSGAAVRLTIAGQVVSANEKDYWERCRALIAQDPEAIRVRDEFIDDDSLPELFAACHCLLLPYTTFFSDSGVAYMALANGRPIIATRAGGLAPLLDSAKLGVQIGEATPDGVRAAIAKALEMGIVKLAGLGQAGAAFVNKELAWSNVAHKTSQIYARYICAPAPTKPRLVVHTPEPQSGAARYVWELVRALAARGAKLTLVCPENFQFRAELESNANVSVQPTRKRCTSNNRRLFTRIRQNLVFLSSSLDGLMRASGRGGIVHFQFAFHFPPGLLFFLCARLRGARTIFTVHDPLPHRWLLPAQFRWLEEGALASAYHLSHRLIAHSEAGKRTLIERFHQDANKISLVPHGPYDLGRGILPMPDSDLLELLIFGAIRENKGVDLAIQAVQALNRQSERVRLTIAGSVLNNNEQPYWDKCRFLIACDPGPICVINEFVPDCELPALFAHCHCVLLPYTEFFSDSGVAQMALSNGRPILATQSGGLAAIMQSTEVGIPIQEISIQGVAEAIRAALRQGVPELERKGQNGATLVHQQGGWKGIAEKTLEVYCLARPQAGASESVEILD